MGTETQPPPVAAEVRPGHAGGVADSAGAPARSSRGGLALALLAVIVVAVGVYAGVAQLVTTPRVHPDEHIYAGAGFSLAEGEGLALRGADYGLGPVYPAVLAVARFLAPDRETAYELFKVANALLFGLAAVPIFFVARRLLGPWSSVGVAAMAIAIPSSMYVSVVMTESASYLAFSIALLAIVLAVERPSTGRQLAALAAMGLAYATRAQFAVLVVAYASALVIAWAIAPDRSRPADALRRVWPTLGALALGAAVVLGRPLVTGSSPLGDYDVLFRGYDPVDLARWGAYHLADLELYLAVVPLAVSPIVLWSLWRRGRAGSGRDAAFLAVFLMVNGGMLFVTAAFASTEFGFDRLHDRNIFYLAPLWLVLLALWLADGLPRPLVATSLGAGLALVLPLLVPFGKIAEDVGVDVVPSALWARIREQFEGEGVNGRHVLMLVVGALIVAVVLLPRKFAWALPAAVLASFALTGGLAWERLIDAPEEHVFTGTRSDKSWVDDRLPDGARVTKLYLVTSSCPASALTWHSLYLTEFFNPSVDRAAYIGDSVPDGLPIERVDVKPEGRLLLASGEPLTAEYVYTQPGIELRGQELARGTAANLVLWQTGGAVELTNAQANDEIRTADCS